MLKIVLSSGLDNICVANAYDNAFNDYTVIEGAERRQSVDGYDQSTTERCRTRFLVRVFKQLINAFILTPFATSETPCFYINCLFTSDQIK